jgi:hypothetical protein
MNTARTLGFTVPAGSHAAALWAARILGAGVTLVLLADGAVNFFAPQLLAQAMTATGFPATLSLPLGTIMVICALLYSLPRTSVLGAILTTAFLGGAICAHFRLGEIGSPPQIVCVAIGIAAWASLWFRQDAIRALIPLKSPRAD